MSGGENGQQTAREWWEDTIILNYVPSVSSGIHQVRVFSIALA
jgi:hypothetical protein